MKEYVTPKYTDAAVDEVWGIYKNKTVTNTVVKNIVIKTERVMSINERIKCFK